MKADKKKTFNVEKKNKRITLAVLQAGLIFGYGCCVCGADKIHGQDLFHEFFVFINLKCFVFFKREGSLSVERNVYEDGLNIC